MRDQQLAGPRGSLIINDAYNANPTSLAAALGVLERASGRTGLVFGDMLELGETAAQAHQEVGRLVAEAGVALLVCVGKWAALAAGAAAEMNVETYVADSPEAAADLLLPLLREGDTILVKASRGMELERTVRRLIDGA